MPRIRTIKPEFFTSLTVASLTPEQRLTFIGLWTHVDDAGRAIDDARLVKAALWPLDDRVAADVDDDLWALTEASLIVRYTFKERSFLAVRNWVEHQRINRPTASTLPDPDDCELLPPPPRPTCRNEDSWNPHGGLTEDSSPERKGREGNGREGNKDTSAIGSTVATVTRLRPDVEEACALLADLVEANGSKRPTITAKWRDAARLMLDKDRIALDDVLGAIRWSQADEFWRSNILSMPKLREKFDTLRLRAQRGHTLAATGTGGYQGPYRSPRDADYTQQGGF
jgi:hypothetical protein